MRSGGKLFVLAGVGLGIVAVVLAIVAMTGSGAADESTDATTKVTVVQAVREIPAHTLLTLDNLVEAEVPAESAPADAVRARAEVLGKSYRVPLVTGQPLLLSQIEQPGLRNEVKVGMRAMSIPADSTSLLSGLIQDGDYVDVVFKARVNQVRLLPTGDYPSAEVAEDGTYKFQEQSIDWMGPDLDEPQQPPAGDPGSKYYLRDDVGDAGELEPVSKVVLQDLHVLRVVRPGESFEPTGQVADDGLTEESVPTAAGDLQVGYLILEVTDQQAELLLFMVDQKHRYQVIVRAKDDHQITSTTGITFQILATDADYALPMPGSVTTAADAATNTFTVSADQAQAEAATPEPTPVP